MKREDWKGVLYTLVFAIAAYVLGSYFPIVGGPVFGILIGMLFARRRRPKSVESGIRFTGKKILQYAIILLGFEMDLFHVAEVGAQSLYVMIFTLIAAFGAAFLMGKALGLDRDMTALVGAGTAICGGSAIAAVAPVIGAKDRDVVISIATIFFFNVLAVFIFPAVGHSYGMTDAGFGMWAGTAINDTSSVVAAGYAYSHEAGAYATIVKLTRTLMIVPVCLFFALLVSRRKEAREGFSLRRIFPMFVLYFVAACVANTSGLLPAEVSHALGALGKFAIVMAMSAIGLNTDLASLVKNGLRPLALGLVCWIAVAGTSIIVQRALGLL
ncbi:YeiH family protein [Selenomonas sp. F0473]|uniref:YeiH family protein n=1 Tax=Selenomonas sp. F0473 TaxID=999423 RepID=UPI00029DF733|nr:YeiH family protein [Selenomonas sp. F0473]EKU70904.1 hypothetical protein HMPREF9161_01453 [Selenomonas sp. F0473]